MAHAVLVGYSLMLVLKGVAIVPSWCMSLHWRYYTQIWYTSMLMWQDIFLVEN